MDPTGLLFLFVISTWLLYFFMRRLEHKEENKNTQEQTQEQEKEKEKEKQKHV